MTFRFYSDTIKDKKEVIDTDPIKLTLAAARINAGYTQREVAEKLGISVDSLCNWERGATRPKEPTVLGLASFYGIPRDSISMPKQSD